MTDCRKKKDIIRNFALQPDEIARIFPCKYDCTNFIYYYYLLLGFSLIVPYREGSGQSRDAVNCVTVCTAAFWPEVSGARGQIFTHSYPTGLYPYYDARVTSVLSMEAGKTQ